MAYQTGQAMAESLLRRHLDEAGEYPQSVGLSVGARQRCGPAVTTSPSAGAARRDAGLGRRVAPASWVWGNLSELGRPRIDVTVRISGFFRDAFPHALAMLDDAVRLVANLDEPSHLNFVRQHAQDDLAAHGDQRRSTTRIFGSKPGSYGARNAAADGSRQLAQ